MAGKKDNPVVDTITGAGEQPTQTLESSDNTPTGAGVNMTTPKKQQKALGAGIDRVQELNTLPSQNDVNLINGAALSPATKAPATSVEISLNDIGARIAALVKNTNVQVQASLRGVEVLKSIAVNPAYADKLDYVLPAITAGRKFGFNPVNGLVQEPILYKIVLPEAEYSRLIKASEDPTAAMKKLTKVDEDRIVRELAAVLPTDAKGQPALIATKSAGTIDVYVDLLKVFASLFPMNVNFAQGEQNYCMVIAMKGNSLNTASAAIIAVRNDFRTALNI
jgi:hypothetical protein